jgi:hypothetical protein
MADLTTRLADQLDWYRGPAEGPYADHPLSGLILHSNREAVHHGAENRLPPRPLCPHQTVNQED